MTDHERIWLQDANDADYDEGRLWCQDNVWDDIDENNPPTEYVRADLHATALTAADALADDVAEWLRNPTGENKRRCRASLFAYREARK